MSPPAVDVTLTSSFLAGARVVAVTIVEGISTLTRAEVETASEEHLDLAAALRSDVGLALTLGGAPARSFALRLGGARFLGIVNGLFRYRLELHPRLWFLRHTLDTRKFRDRTAQEIVSSVLSGANEPLEWRITASVPKRNYCVQYRESNLAFVSRLLEREGIYFTFTESDVLELGDRSATADFVAGERHFELLDAEGALTHGKLGIHAFEKTAAVAPGRATVNDFDWKRPALDLVSSAAAGEDSELETYDYPAGFRDPERGAFLARILLEAHRVPSRTALGRSNVAAFAPLRRFIFGERAGDELAGEYLLIEVEHRALSLPREEAGYSYENQFRAIPAQVPFRPAWKTPRPTVKGFHTAIVRGPAGAEIHTDQHGRFRAQMHWDREAEGTDADSRWLRLMQEPSTSMALARVGWEMNVAYIDGDPDRPIGVGRNINGVMPPAYALPAHQTEMTVRTPTSPASGGFHELRLDDRAGAQSFSLRAERDFIGVVKRDRTERVGHDEVRAISGSHVHGVERDQTVRIGGDSATVCGGEERLAVRGDRSVAVGGSETIEVSASSEAAVLGDDSEIVGGARITLAGLGGDGAIRRRTAEDLSRTAGGAFVTVAQGNARTLVQRDLSEAIAGADLVLAKGGSIAQTTGGARRLTVAGSLFRTSGEDMGISAQHSRVEVAGAASLRSEERVELRGHSIVLEARAGLRLTAPGLSIELTPGSVALAGDVALEAGVKVTTTGGPDNITG
jgi:type VI secretion system secreted protein VgrG